MRCVGLVALVAFLGATAAPASAVFHCTITGEDMESCCCRTGDDESLQGPDCCCEIRKPQSLEDATSSARVPPSGPQVILDLPEARLAPLPADCHAAGGSPEGPATRAAPRLLLLLGNLRT